MVSRCFSSIRPTERCCVPDSAKPLKCGPRVAPRHRRCVRATQAQRSRSGKGALGDCAGPAAAAPGPGPGSPRPLCVAPVLPPGESRWRVSGPRAVLFRKNATRPYSSLPGEAVFANSTGMLVVAFGLLVLYLLQASSWKRPEVEVTTEGQVRPCLPGQAGGGLGLEKGHRGGVGLPRKTSPGA